MPVFLKDSRRLLFVHVPKTGGTSIERLLRANGWEQRLRMNDRDPLFGALRCSPQHLHAAPLRELFRLPRFDLVFMLVRHPVDRFRSEYAMRNTADLHVDADSVDRWAARVFAAYDNNPYAYDNHLRPQTEFLLPRAEVYRLEDGLAAMVEDLNGRFELGLPLKIPHARNRARRAGVPTTEVEVSPSTAALLQERYAADFERFGYSGTSWREQVAHDGQRSWWRRLPGRG